MENNFEWYVVSTFSSYENRVKSGIEKSIEGLEIAKFFDEIRVPVEEVTKLLRGKKKTIMKRIYPGYVFIKMVLNDDTWRLVRRVQGVTGFVGPENKPLSLTKSEVSRLGGDDGKVFVLGFGVGDTITVTKGTLEGFIGKVTEINMETSKLKVNLSMFGRETEVELEFDQVDSFVQ